MEVACTQHGCATVSAQATCLSLPPTVQQKSRKGKHWQHGPPSCEMLPVQQESWFWFCVWDFSCSVFFFWNCIIVCLSFLLGSSLVQLVEETFIVFYSIVPLAYQQGSSWQFLSSNRKNTSLACVTCDTSQCEDEAGKSPNAICCTIIVAVSLAIP